MSIISTQDLATALWKFGDKVKVFPAPDQKNINGGYDEMVYVKIPRMSGSLSKDILVSKRQFEDAEHWSGKKASRRMDPES